LTQNLADFTGILLGVRALGIVGNTSPYFKLYRKKSKDVPSFRSYMSVFINSKLCVNNYLNYHTFITVGARYIVVVSVLICRACFTRIELSSCAVRGVRCQSDPFSRDHGDLFPLRSSSLLRPHSGLFAPTRI